MAPPSPPHLSWEEAGRLGTFLRRKDIVVCVGRVVVCVTSVVFYSPNFKSTKFVRGYNTQTIIV